MISKKNKYIKHVLILIILASCTSTSENLRNSSNVAHSNNLQRNIEEIYTYKNFFISDLEVIQQAIESQNLSQTQLRDIRLLKNNYQKILSKNKYKIELGPSQKYSKELIELIYQYNLPINISWNKDENNMIPEEILQNKIEGFCSSLFDDSISSINKEITSSPGAILIIYSEEYGSFTKGIKSANENIYTIKYDESNSQIFASKILGINLSNERFKKISDLNPNQMMNFKPRSRADIKQIVLILKPIEYKAIVPALRYHGGDKFKYVNFISSLEGLSDPLQLLDYEDSFAPISKFFSRKIQSESSTSIEGFLKYGALGDWMINNILKQAGVESAKIDGLTGTVFYNSNSCNRRVIPMQRISSDLFSS